MAIIDKATGFYKVVIDASTGVIDSDVIFNPYGHGVTVQGTLKTTTGTPLCQFKNTLYPLTFIQNDTALWVVDPIDYSDSFIAVTQGVATGYIFTCTGGIWEIAVRQVGDYG